MALGKVMTLRWASSMNKLAPRHVWCATYSHNGIRRGASLSLLGAGTRALNLVHWGKLISHGCNAMTCCCKPRQTLDTTWHHCSSKDASDEWLMSYIRAQCHGMMLHQEGSRTKAWCSCSKEGGLRCMLSIGAQCLMHVDDKPWAQCYGLSLQPRKTWEWHEKPQ